MLDLAGVKNIIFDLGGVIINIDQEKVYSELADYGITKEQLISDSGIFKIYEKGEISSAQFIQRIQVILPSLIPDRIIEIWNSMLLDIPEDRIRLLQKLSKRYSIYLLSNTNEIHMNHIQKYVHDRFGIPKLDDLFRKAYYSYQMGMRKPNKNIFLRVLKENELNPKETLFIDDSEEHILSAEQIHLKTYWLDVKNGKTITKLFE